MPQRNKDYIKACLEEAIRWIDENDELPTKQIDLGVWFSDLAQSEVLSFIERPYYNDYIDANMEDCLPYQLILIPLDKNDPEFEECYKRD